MNDRLNVNVVKCVIIYSIAFALCRLSNGYFTIFVAVLGCVFAGMQRVGLAISSLLFLSFLGIANPILLPKDGSAYTIGLRFGSFFLMLMIGLRSMRIRSSWKPPVAFLYVFLLAAIFSSIGGWAPNVSFMKIIQFGVFLFCVINGAKLLRTNPKDCMNVRISLLALAAIVTFFSLALYPFPEVSSLDALKIANDLKAETLDVELIVRERIASGMGVYFCGITNQSQALAPVISCLYIYVLCDALFIERRFRWLHLLLLFCALPIFYLTRSRVGMLSLVVGAVMVVFYAGRYIAFPRFMMRRVHLAIGMWLFLLFTVAIWGQIKDEALTKWIRKTNDVSADNRSFVEAVSASRQGLVEYCLWEFKQNPLLGMGFQTSYQHKRLGLDKAGWLIVSAPIEKGVLPLMVLGETGIVGTIIFFIFLLQFYYNGHRKRMYITVVLFTVLLATNMGEAGFFSPGAEGGLDWIICVIGGFASDTIIVARQAIDRIGPFNRI